MGCYAAAADEQLAPCSHNPLQEAKKAGSAPALQGSKDDLFGSETNKNRKRTEEGYAIYTEDELKLGSKGGDTDLCPFDCDCCF